MWIMEKDLLSCDRFIECSSRILSMLLGFEASKAIYDQVVKHNGKISIKCIHSQHSNYEGSRFRAMWSPSADTIFMNCKEMLNFEDGVIFETLLFEIMNASRKEDICTIRRNVNLMDRETYALSIEKIEYENTIATRSIMQKWYTSRKMERPSSEMGSLHEHSSFKEYLAGLHYPLKEFDNKITHTEYFRLQHDSIMKQLRQ